jgi:hypothetical protein
MRSFVSLLIPESAYLSTKLLASFDLQGDFS